RGWGAVRASPARPDEAAIRYAVDMRRCCHYERAFEAYLRSRRIPYVAVDEARKTLLPGPGPGTASRPAIKSFDFVVYGRNTNLLVDIKGRRVAYARRRAGSPLAVGRLDSWVT